MRRKIYAANHDKIGETMSDIFIEISEPTGWKCMRCDFEFYILLPECPRCRGAIEPIEFKGGIKRIPAIPEKQLSSFEKKMLFKKLKIPYPEEEAI